MLFETGFSEFLSVAFRVAFALEAADALTLPEGTFFFFSAVLAKGFTAFEGVLTSVLFALAEVSDVFAIFWVLVSAFGSDFFAFAVGLVSFGVFGVAFFTCGLS